MKIIEKIISEPLYKEQINNETHFSQNHHEQIVYCQDKTTGLQSIICIHDTTLGPAIGGVRFFEYEDEKAALKDALRLSRGMTYKAAIAGLDVGGGKAVIIKKKDTELTEPLLRAYGKYVERLGGYFITAPDYNTTIEHMLQVAKSTRHVVGLPLEVGGSGDPSKNTAYGVYISMKAAVKKAFGTDSLINKKIGIAGIGKVGSHLAELLCKEEAIVYISDICTDRVNMFIKRYKVEVVAPESLLSFPLDIYAPCALGSVLNRETIAQLNCAIIVGAANNQLAHEEEDGKRLLEKGIIYVPDFVANSGGLINAVTELNSRSFNKKLVMQRTEQLYGICLNILEKADKAQCSTQKVGQEMALTRLHNIKNLRLN